MTGTPTLALSDNEVARYTSGSGTGVLTFSYTVQPGDDTADLQVTGLNLPSGATIADSAGHALSGGVAQDLNLQINKFINSGNGEWSGSGNLNNPSDWLVFDTSTNQVVQATYPSAGAVFVGGGTLQASGAFPYVGLGIGNYVLTGNLNASGKGIDLATLGTASLSMESGTTVSTGFVNVGNAGSGSLTIQDGAIVSANSFTISNQSSGSGALTVQGGAKLAVTQGVEVGYGGTGNLTVSDGGELTADYLNIGHQAGTSGNVEITGGNTLVDTTGGQQYQNVLIGIDGTASLTIEGKATVKTMGLEAASALHNGITDTLSVNDANLFVTQYAVIGQSGSASATFSNNADITATGLTIGSNAGASGVVKVDGGATINAGDFVALAVSADTSGELDVSGGGTVQTAQLGLGGTPSGSGGTAKMVVGSDGAVSVTQVAGLYTGAIDVTGGGAVDIGSNVTSIAGAIHVGTDGSFYQLPGSGTISGNLIDDGTISVSGTLHVTSSANIDSGGVEDVSSGGSVDNTIINSGGSVVVSSGGTIVAPTINGGSLELQTGALVSGAINFAPTAQGTFQIDDLASAPGGVQQTDFKSEIRGFALGDVIRVEGFGNFTTIDATTPIYSSSSNTTTLTLTDPGSPVATLTLVGDYSSDEFTVKNDPNISGAVDLQIGTAPTGQLSGSISLTSATEGAALPSSSTVATFTDTDTSEAASAFTATINWGDGTTTTGTVSGANGSFTVAGGHSYADEGTDTLTVTVTRTADGTQIAPSGTITVADAALTAGGTTVSGTEGAAISSATVATFTDANPNAMVGDFTATIDWGDGTSTAGTVVVQSGGGFAVDGGHTYADEGQFKIGVTIDDVGASKTSATSNANIADAALTASGTTVSATKGVAISGETVATFTDANAEATGSDFSATINWGDGTSTTGTIVAQSGGGFAVDGTHTYADGGQFNIGVSIHDVGGSTASASSAATVQTSVTAAQAIANYQANPNVAPQVVVDTATNVGANLDGLETLASANNIASIKLTDSGTPTLTITATQLANDALALEQIVAPFTITATGTIGAAAAARHSVDTCGGPNEWTRRCRYHY